MKKLNFGNLFAFSVVFLFAISMMSISALGEHTSEAELQPEWSPADSDVDYTVTFCKTTGDTINEVRIYKNYDGSIYYT